MLRRLKKKITRSGERKELTKNEQESLNRQLLNASRNGNIKATEYFISQGASKGAIGKNGRNAALTAAASGQQEMYDHLIKNHGFLIGAIDKYGDNALTLADWKGKESMVKQLVDKHGFDPSFKQENKTTEELERERGNKEIEDYLKGKEKELLLPSLEEKRISTAPQIKESTADDNAQMPDILVSAESRVFVGRYALRPNPLSAPAPSPDHTDTIAHILSRQTNLEAELAEPKAESAQKKAELEEASPQEKTVGNSGQVLAYAEAEPNERTSDNKVLEQRVDQLQETVIENHTRTISYGEILNERARERNNERDHAQRQKERSKNKNSGCCVTM
jgi:hypothetical protein